MSELTILFDRDPLSYSEQDIATIVTKMREQQANYELGIKAPSAAKARPKTPKTQALLTELFGGPSDLGDLGLK